MPDVAPLRATTRVYQYEERLGAVRVSHMLVDTEDFLAGVRERCLS